MPWPRDLLRAMFDAAIAAAQPARCIPSHLPAKPPGRLVVIGAGKASAAMAKAVEDHWSDELSGFVVTRYGYAVSCERIEIFESAHPVPDANSLVGAQRMLAAVRGLSSDDLVLFLMSGGASSLLVAPIQGMTLEDKRLVNRALLNCGASISEMNCVRRHLSAIKGGRLAVACHPAKVVTLVISDVPGDQPSDIGSGPTIGDPTTCADALAVLRRYQLELSEHVVEVLRSGRGESIKPNDPRLAQNEVHCIATPQMALRAAADVARNAGFAVHILSDRVEGEARDVAKVVAAIAL
jgi:glycerate 2-kinase